MKNIICLQSNRRLLIVLILVLPACFSQRFALSQTIECQTGFASLSFVSPVQAFYTNNDTLNYYYDMRQERTVSVKLHLVRRSDGSGGLDTAQVDQIVPLLNAAFSGNSDSNDTKIRFSKLGAISVIDSSTFFRIDNENELQALFQLNRAPNSLNIYVVERIDAFGGLAGIVEGIPSRAFALNYFTVQNQTTTIAHEVGHCFWLYHTYQFQDYIVGDDTIRLGKESRTRGESDSCYNALRAGDQLHDTKADAADHLGSFPPYCDGIRPMSTPQPDNFMSQGNQRSRFTPQQIARMHYILSFYLSDVTQTPVAFGNYYQSELITNTPTRPSTLTVNEEMVNSGQALSLLIGREYYGKTNQERFIGYVSPTQGTLNVKHQNWNSVSNEFRLSEIFTANTEFPERRAEFLPYQPATVRAALIDGLNFNWAGIELRDPWRVDSQGNQPNAFAFYPSTSNNTNGVFQGQEIEPSRPFYAVRVGDTVITSGGITGVRVDRIPNLTMPMWEGTGVSVQQPNSTETPVVFNAPNAVVSARYKGRLLSSVGEARSQSGSQRRFARDVSSTQVFYLVYESAGKIWLTHTTNSGTSWSNERYLGDGKNAHHAIGLKG